MSDPFTTYGDLAHLDVRNERVGGAIPFTASYLINAPVTFQALLLAFTFGFSWFACDLYDGHDIQSNGWVLALVLAAFFGLSVPLFKRDCAEMCLAYVLSFVMLLVFEMSVWDESHHLWHDSLTFHQRYYNTNFDGCGVTHKEPFRLAAFRSYTGHFFHTAPLWIAFGLAALCTLCAVLWARRAGNYHTCGDFLTAAGIRAMFVFALLAPFVRQGVLLNGDQGFLGKACLDHSALSLLHLRAQASECRVPSCIHYKGTQLLAIPVSLLEEDAAKGFTPEDWRAKVLADPHIHDIGGLADLEWRLTVLRSDQMYSEEEEGPRVTVVNRQLFLPVRTLAAAAYTDAAVRAAPFVHTVYNLRLDAFCSVFQPVWAIGRVLAYLRDMLGGWVFGTVLTGAVAWKLDTVVNMGMFALNLSDRIYSLGGHGAAVVSWLAARLCNTYANERFRRVWHCLAALAVGFVVYFLATVCLVRMQVDAGVYSAPLRVVLGLTRQLVVAHTGTWVVWCFRGDEATIPVVPVVLVFGHELSIVFLAGARHAEPLLMLLACSTTLAVYMLRYWNRDQSEASQWGSGTEEHRVNRRVLELEKQAEWGEEMFAGWETRLRPRRRRDI